MSVATALSNLKNRIQDAYTALSGKGATIPQEKTTANLPSTINTITQLKGFNGSYYLTKFNGSTYTPGSPYNAFSKISITPYLYTPGNVTPSTNNQTIALTSTQKNSYCGIKQVTVNGVTNAIDSNIQSGNIKMGVTILGVSGSYTGSGGGSLQGYTVTISCSGGGSSVATGTIFKSDGSTIAYSVSSQQTFQDVIYVQTGDMRLGDAYMGIQTTQKIAILSDCTLYFGFECLLEGTRINLSNGKTKPVEDITYNDDILCWDFDKGKYASAKPFWIKQAQQSTVYWINKFESGRVIKTTGTVAGHRFFNVSKNKFLYNTECLNDLCYTMDGNDKLIECKKIEEKCTFYNVYTYYHMNLFANEILTGFRYSNLYPIENMKFIKDNRKQRLRDEFKGIPDSWYYGMRCSEQTDSVENITNYCLSSEVIKK